MLAATSACLLFAAAAAAAATAERVRSPALADACFRLPPELTSAPTALLRAPRRDQNWLRSATILQPWGPTQYELIANATRLAPLLAERFGFNTIIFLPAPAHLSYCAAGGACGLTAAEIAAGVDTFRAAGWRVILYTSFMHVGEARAWTNGSVNAAHPSWAQRNASGAPWLFEGANSPLTPCSEDVLAFTTGYAVEQQRAMHMPDATMLDNNEMGPLTWGCASSGCGYEPACAAAFSTYIRARFNDSILRDCFGVTGPATSPVQPPPRPAEGNNTALYGLWVHWRNVAMASLNRRFGSALRGGSGQQQQHHQLFANTAIDWPDFSLAQDLQYQAEDAVLTEIYNTDPLLMHFSLSLGVGVAEVEQRPFIAALYQNAMHAVQLPPRALEQVLVSAAAHHVRPWLVFESNLLNDSDASAKTLHDVHSWLATEGDVLTDGQNLAPVACLASAATRNFGLAANHTAAEGDDGVAISPKRCLRRAAELGAPARVVFDGHYNSSGWLRGVRLLVLDNVRCLPQGAIKRISQWVASGSGVLLASPGSGECDSLGRTLPGDYALHAQIAPGASSATFASVRSSAAAALFAAEAWTVSQGGGDENSTTRGVVSRVVLPYASASHLTLFVLCVAPEPTDGSGGGGCRADDSVSLRIPQPVVSNATTTKPRARVTAVGLTARELPVHASTQHGMTVEVPPSEYLHGSFAVVIGLHDASESGSGSDAR
jgi:hypothetical protein